MGSSRQGLIDRLRRPRRLIREMLLGGMTGMLVLGIGGRALMRLIAVAAGLPTGFSWGGSLEVAALGGIIGLIAGAVFSLLSSVRPTGWPIAGAVAGLGTFAAVLLLPIDGKAAIGLLPGGYQPTAIAAFAGLFVIFGLVLARLAPRNCQ